MIKMTLSKPDNTTRTFQHDRKSALLMQVERFLLETPEQELAGWGIAPDEHERREIVVIDGDWLLDARDGKIQGAMVGDGSKNDAVLLFLRECSQPGDHIEFD